MSKFFMRNSESIFKKLQEDVNNAVENDKNDLTSNKSESREKRTTIDYTRKSKNMTAYNPVKGRRKI